MQIDDIPAWLDGRVPTGEFSGSVLVTRRGETVLEHAAGLAHRGHGVPNRPDTRFSIASVTKLAVAVMALRLVERGLVDLHGPLTEILPEAHRPAALTPAHTLHHLLAHTSGLANYHDDEDETWASWMACWDRIPTYHVRRPADMLPLFADLPAVRPPGEAYQYCDAGYILVGLAVEAVTGRRWEDVLAEEVLVPAGMADTAVEALDEDPARLAIGYVIDEGPVDRRRSNIYSLTANGMPDGGMLSTTGDLARLIDALVGGQLLGPELLAAMTRPQSPPTPGEVDRYGYGCSLVPKGDAIDIIGHGGGDPGVASLVSHHLATGTTIVVLCNQDRGAGPTTQAITEALGLEDARFA